MTRAARQVQDERPLLLLEGPVDDSHRHLQPAEGSGPEQRVQGDGRGEWWEPDLVDRPACADQAADQGLQVGGDEGGGEPGRWGGVHLEGAAPGAEGR